MEKPDSNWLKPCGKCSKPASHSCGHCRKVSYCSAQCQKSDRKKHKYECYPMEREENVYTRVENVNYFATRDIKAGEVIYEERPLLIGPATVPSSQFDRLSQEINLKVGQLALKNICLGCSVLMDELKLCTDCQWPLCGPSCPTLNMHKSAECQVFSSRKVHPKHPSDNLGKLDSFEYSKVRYVRALLLRTQDPIRWEELMKLFPYCDPSQHNLFMPLGDAEISSVTEFIQKSCGMEEFDADTIYKVMRIDSNLMIEFQNEKIYLSHFLDQISSTFHHSCIPNVWSSPAGYGTYPNGVAKKIKTIAIVDIKEGDKLTVIGEELWGDQGTLKRRKIIYNYYGQYYCDNNDAEEVQKLESLSLKEKEKLLWCKCPRCVDPTELGSYFSAVKCKQCLRGYLLPKDPLDPNSIWICDSRNEFAGDCLSEVTIDELEPLFKKLESEFEVISSIDNVTETTFEDWAEKEEPFYLEMEEFVKKYSKVLHPNHRIIFKMKSLILSGLYIQFARIPRPRRLNEKLQKERYLHLDKMQELGEYILKITDILYPGITLARAHDLLMCGMTKLLKLHDLVLTDHSDRAEAERLAKQAMILYRKLRDISKPLSLESLHVMDEKLIEIKSAGKNSSAFARWILPMLNVDK